MEVLFYILAGLAFLVLVWGILNFNALVRLRQHCRESWAGIDTELKRRYDLVPNLVETVKGYAAHEREVFRAVTEARGRAVASTGSPAAQAADENPFVGALTRLLAVAEDYPDLKASDHFLELQRELANTEDRIQAARRFYNGNVRDLNTRVEAFPSNLVAALFRFKQEEFFKIADVAVRAAPQAGFERAP
ncbi:MAG: LemA family protein [Planctomycetota bacterium]|jgi:LemA protein